MNVAEEAERSVATVLIRDVEFDTVISSRKTPTLASEPVNTDPLLYLNINLIKILWPTYDERLTLAKLNSLSQLALDVLPFPLRPHTSLHVPPLSALISALKRDVEDANRKRL